MHKKSAPEMAETAEVCSVLTSDNRAYLEYKWHR
jgi:hypothetical protein